MNPTRREPVDFRAAVPADASSLLELERSSSEAALGHVFAPAAHPYPVAAVLARWHEVLVDADVWVEVVDRPSRHDAPTGAQTGAPTGAPAVDCLVAYDATTVRHLGVRPERWGGGLGRAAVARAASVISAGGATARLWCLAEGAQALAFYARIGWAPTGAERRAEWPPRPREVELSLGPDGAGR